MFVPITRERSYTEIALARTFVQIVYTKQSEMQILLFYTLPSMKNIEKILALQKRNAEFNGWFTNCNDFYYHFCLLDELAEVKHELLNHDFKKLEDEMGDVLWTCLNLIAKLESRGYIDSERMIE